MRGDIFEKMLILDCLLVKYIYILEHLNSEQEMEIIKTNYHKSAYDSYLQTQKLQNAQDRLQVIIYHKK